MVRCMRMANGAVRMDAATVSRPPSGTLPAIR